MASPRRGRSSSLFSPSSLRSPSSDWLVSFSPSTSQSQPPPIRQRTKRKMSPGKPSTATSADRPSQKRTSSFSGFFSKILPSNRPEQGGTYRTTDWTGDEEIDPSELTDWNIAKEKSPAHHTTSLIVPDESIHRRVWSWSPQKGDSRFVENLPRDRSLGRERSPDKPDREPLPPRKSEALNRAEVHELLKSKEMSRKSRRSLKESGDWLGVQGADPYSGQFPVLTPTDTPSSETTSNSTRGRLAGLSRKKKAAKLEYEQAKLLEEQEKDKARLNKEQAKLNKLEHAKEELKRQNSSPKWSQHKRQWSSAAEPSLSPIAQSLDSVALGSSETSSLLFSEMPTDSASSDPEEITVIPNFSRPNRPPVTLKATSGQAERLSCDGSQRRGHERRDLSTDTIIHTLPDTNPDSASLTRPVTQPSEENLSIGQSDIGRTKSERHFLWRRRRETDPGKSVSTPPVSLITSMRNKNRTSNSVQYIPKDHFADLDIPDYRLHLLSPEPADTGDSQSTHSEDSQLTTPNLSSLGVMGGSKLALSSTTNLARSLGNDRSTQSINGATATSSQQSKLKGIMRRPSKSIRRKLTPSLLGTAHTKEMERNQRSPPTFDQVQDHSVNHLPEDIPECQSQHLQSDLQGRISLEQAETILPLDKKAKSARRGSVSIPITTTTGCVDLALVSLSDFPRPKLSIETKQINGHTGATEFSTIPTSSRQQECHIIPEPIQEEFRTTSPPTVIQNGSPNLEPPQETPGIDIISTREAAPEKKPPIRVSISTIPRLYRPVQQNLETKDAEMRKNTDTVVGIESTKIQALKPVVDSNGTTKQEKQGRKISQERQNKGSTQIPKVASQEAHRRVLLEKQKENMLEEATRIAILRSKTKEMATNRSADRKAGRNRSRSPSPVKKHMPSKATEPKHSLQQKRPKKKRHSEEGGGTGLPSKHEHVKRSTTQTQTQHKRGSTERIDWADVTATAVQFCKTVYVVFLGLACTWWAMVRPAFDQQSDLWRRRHRKQSTWEDAIVFISAGVFCLAGGLSGWYASKILWWLIE
ncbi:uncharacterized protein GGS22DRAFT_152677 [Annulohypoxylon maeteangense]|uniref:uncharacterized protein n=1 Tax=Annulohypoxylon maeteangense TaxID=1927788 RepID=UPI002007915B|nr:uncharacterized protein GGS22DRAFT_152677 [Annulohypoxylon maeteangense]KAI0888910.1 hypothetical protein GGS22DRAFT_152677 [Annulohypoxylon maeteangense]